MPNYTFENKETGEQFIAEMKILELDEYKKNHPELIQVLTPTGTVDPVLLGVRKPSREFQKEVLGRIKQGAGKNSTIGTGRWEV